MTPKFIKVPSFDIYDEDHERWSEADRWWLDGELVYQSALEGEDGQHVLVTVPDRFETDLASIPHFPPFLRTVFEDNGKHRPAAVVHDYLCGLGLAFPRVLADKIFYEAMKLVGVKRWQRRLMYMAVRINTERLILFGKARRMVRD